MEGVEFMKLIDGYKQYFISEAGEVYNALTDKFLKGSIGENGYLYYRLSNCGKKKMFYAHRLVAEYYVDNPNHLPIVNHIDGNKLNNHYTNLEWVDYSQNTKHWHEISNNSRKITEYYTQDLENEIWKPFKNYMVSSCGRIRHAEKNNLLRPSIASGYYKVRLSENGLTQDYMVHHLVYKLFINDNYDKTHVIDHIDGNKLNNNVNNLRLVTLSENVLSALYNTKTNKTAKQVYQYDLNNNLLNIFDSAREAGRQLNLDSSTISKVCRGINKTHGGFIFRYSTLS